MSIVMFFFLMIRRPPRSTRTDTLFPYTTLFRSVAEEKYALEAKGIPAGSPRIGAMIEIPSAVLLVNEIVEAADLVSLCTNDLVQYLLAVDRDNEDRKSTRLNSSH